MNVRTANATKVLGGLSMLAITGLGWVFVVGPETTALSDVRISIEDTRAQNSALAAQLAVLEEQRDGLPVTQRVARALAEKFPPTADQPGLFEQVTASAVAAGIGPQGVTTLAPTAPTVGVVDPAAGVQLEQDAAGEQLARQDVTVSVTGSYDQTKRLLENLEQMPRAYLVTSVTVSGGEEGEYVTTVSGEMFLLRPAPEPGETAPASAPTTD